MKAFAALVVPARSSRSRGGVSKRACRVLLAITLLAGTPALSHAFERDFHYYVIYLLLRARGYSAADSDQLAGFSQYIDDNAQTEPMLQTWAVRARFHFDDSAPNKATVPQGFGAGGQLSGAFERFRQNPATGKYHVGEVLHRLADSYPHAGFTAWWNSDINQRTGSWRPDIGHADAADDGHSPDRPYNTPDYALAAAAWLYQVLPAPVAPGRTVSWSELEPRLRAAFQANAESEKPLEARIREIQGVIADVVGDQDVQYDKKKFAAERREFEAELQP
jgi:hypothetical protein